MQLLLFSGNFHEVHILYAQNTTLLKLNLLYFATYRALILSHKSCDFAAQNSSMALPYSRDNREDKALYDMHHLTSCLQLTTQHSASKIQIFWTTCDSINFDSLVMPRPSAYVGNIVKGEDQSFWAPLSLFKSWLYQWLAPWLGKPSTRLSPVSTHVKWRKHVWYCIFLMKLLHETTW